MEYQHMKVCSKCYMMKCIIVRRGVCMDIRRLLRNDFSNKIIPLYKKEKCENCCCEENLELHHVRTFDEILTFVLDKLSLNELDPDMYTEDELYSIKSSMIYEQLDSGYKTLCIECHNLEHFKLSSRYIDIDSECKRINKVFEYYFKKNIMFEGKGETLKLCYEINIRNKKGRIFTTAKSINDKIYELYNSEKENIHYKIEVLNSKNRTTKWRIKKIN